MKKLYNVVLVAIIGATSVFGTINTGAFEPIEIYASTNEIKVTVDGKAVNFTKYNSYPKMLNGTTYVPLRSVFEALGAVEDTTKTKNVLGDEGINNPNIYVFESKVGKYSVVLTLNTKERMQPFESYYTVSYKVGTTGALMDFHKNDIIVENGITYLPLRGISEAFGYEVKWDSKNNTVSIDTSNPTCEGMQIVDRKLNEQKENANTTPVVNNNTTTPSNNNNNTNTSTTEKKTSTTEKKTRTKEEQNQIMLEHVNTLRAEHGLNPLELDETLVDFAFMKAEDWNLGGYSDNAKSTTDGYTSYHVSPRYGSPIAWYNSIYNTDLFIVENFSKRSGTEYYVTNAFGSWVRSDGHLKAMLRPNLTKMGFGYALIEGSEDKFNTTYVSLLEMY